MKKKVKQFFSKRWESDFKKLSPRGKGCCIPHLYSQITSEIQIKPHGHIILNGAHLSFPLKDLTTAIKYGFINARIEIAK